MRHDGTHLGSWGSEGAGNGQFEKPACGIYVGNGQTIEVVDNHISVNGPAGRNSTLARGIRAGLYLVAGTRGWEDSHAARICGNIVNQPVSNGFCMSV